MGLSVRLLAAFGVFLGSFLRIGFPRIDVIVLPSRKISEEAPSDRGSQVAKKSKAIPPALLFTASWPLENHLSMRMKIRPCLALAVKAAGRRILIASLWFASKRSP